MNKKIFTIGLLTLSIMSLGSCGNGNGGGVECPTFTVTYYLNDGTDAVYQSFEVVSQTSATKPDNPTREGYIFKGWFADSECLVSYVSTTKVTADTSIYAKWIVDTSSKDETSSDVTTSDTPSTSIPNENVTTYTVTDLPDWITNDGCVIFAWVWGPNNTGEWIPTEFTSTTSLKFDVDEEITGMLLDVVFQEQQLLTGLKVAINQVKFITKLKILLLLVE